MLSFEATQMRSMLMLLAFILSLIVPVYSGLNVNFYQDSQCTVLSNVWKEISQPSIAFQYNTQACISSNGVSGLPGVQWLAYSCVTGEANYAAMNEYTYSTNANNSLVCPYDVNPDPKYSNWSLTTSDGTPGCQFGVVSVYNATTGMSPTARAYMNVQCTDTNNAHALSTHSYVTFMLGVVMLAIFFF
jgi:hypothetical protein